MAGRILKDDIEALRRQADIVAVVGDYTTLKRAGRSFKGLCPFHTEKTPSFTVTPEGNFYHCFGCGESGDIYDFLRRVEGLEFPEAVESLARRTGYSLRYEELSPRQRQAIGTRSRLVEVTRAAQEHFHATLFDASGAIARAYLSSRGFVRADAEAFGLGFATMEWSNLTDALIAQGFAADDLITVGLAMRGNTGRLRDRFRGRVIFPVEDASGDVIGFGGRTVPEIDYGDFDPPKYVNSPETPLYKKSQVLYGLRQARTDIVRDETVLVCEGYTDVLALHQVGVGIAVATCGTAVGAEHLRMVARYAKRVVLAFDADDAGVKAAERAWEAARDLSADQGVGLDLRVLVLPDGEDPADFARNVGAEGVRAALANATPVVPFIVHDRLAHADLMTEGGRTAALRDAIAVVGREPDLDLRREWARTAVADQIGVAYDFVVRTAHRMGVAIDGHEGVAAAARDEPSRSDSAVERSRARRERAVLRVALQHPELLPDEWFELNEHDFLHPRAQAIWCALHDAGGAGVSVEAVLAAADDDDLRALVRAIALEDDGELIGGDNDDASLAAAVAAERVRRLLADRIASEEADLRAALANLHHGHDAAQIRDLQRALSDLQQRRRALITAGG